MKVKNFLKSFFYYVFSIIFIASSIIVAPTYAEVKLPTGREDEFAENNIVFYNPDGNSMKSRCHRTGTGNCNFIGDTYKERMWSGLRNYGFSPEQAAGLMGNFLHEGGTPVRQEQAYITARNQNCKTQEGREYTIWLDNINGDAHHADCMWKIMGSGDVYKPGTGVAGIGLGFAQWTSHNLRLGYLSRIEEAGLMDYFEGDAYNIWGSIGDDASFKNKVIAETGSDADWLALWCIALGYIYDQFSTNTGFLAESTAEDVAGWVSANYEKCSTCSVGSSGWTSRREKAAGIYQEYLSGTFDNVESHVGEAGQSDPSQTNAHYTNKDETGANITLIGDSISVGAESEIKALYPELTDFNAETGRRFDAGVTLAEGKDLKDIIVFALGSNGGVSEDQANKLLTLAGDKVIVFITNYSRGNNDFTANNALFKTMSASHPNVVIADWASAVASDPEKYVRIDPDGVDVHPTIGDGTKKFAEVLHEAIANGGTKASNLLDCVNDGGTGVLVEGGFKTVEEANSYIMNAYRNINPRNYGDSDAGDAVLKSYHIANVSGCASDLENCPAFVAYFITKYIPGVDLGAGLPDGGKVVNHLINNHGFSDEGTTPKVYSIFSNATHTGVVLGTNGDKIIIGEAGCGENVGFSWTAAHEYPLAGWTNGNYHYAYRDVNL